MDRAKRKRERRQRIHRSVRRKVAGTSERPRLAVFKSLKYIYAQIIDDGAGRTLAQATSQEPELRAKVDGGGKTRAAARLVGEAIAERAKTKGIQKVIFDRGGYIYHGKVKDLAEGARSKGLVF